MYYHKSCLALNCTLKQFSPIFVVHQIENFRDCLTYHKNDMPKESSSRAFFWYSNHHVMSSSCKVVNLQSCLWVVWTGHGNRFRTKWAKLHSDRWREYGEWSFLPKNCRISHKVSSLICFYTRVCRSFGYLCHVPLSSIGGPGNTRYGPTTTTAKELGTFRALWAQLDCKRP